MIAQAVQMERTDERMSRMLYYNGTVITMEEPFCAQAVLTEDVLSRLYGIPVARCEMETVFGRKTICMPVPGGMEDA